MNHPFRYTDCRDWIADEFKQMQRRNPLVSLRSFARKLEMTPSQLSDLLAHRKGISPQKALKIANKLKLNNEETHHFLLLAVAKHGRSPSKRKWATEKLTENAALLQSNIPIEMEEAMFDRISGWENYAILEILETTHHSITLSECAHLLDIPTNLCQTIMNNLVKIGIISQEFNEISHQEVYLKAKSTPTHLTTTVNVPSAAIKEHHRQILGKATESLYSTPVQKRDFSSLTFAFDPDRIEEVREQISQFLRKMSDLFECGKRNQIYTLSIQFFPLSREVSK